MNEWWKALNDRMKSPFYWAFIFSWCVVNWRIILIILNPEGYGCKDMGIGDCISHHLDINNPYYLYTFWLPILGVGIYTLLVPLLDYLVAKIKMNIDNWYRENITYSKDRLVTGRELKRKDEVIFTLEKNSAERETEKTHLFTQRTGLIKEINDLRAEILKYKEQTYTYKQFFEFHQLRFVQSGLQGNSPDYYTAIFHDDQLIDLNEKAGIPRRQFEILLYRIISKSEMQMIVKSKGDIKAIGVMDFKIDIINDELKFVGQFEEITAFEETRIGYNFEMYKINSYFHKDEKPEKK
jgi:hypothetical protein